MRCSPLFSTVLYMTTTAADQGLTARTLTIDGKLTADYYREVASWAPVATSFDSTVTHRVVVGAGYSNTTACGLRSSRSPFLARPGAGITCQRCKRSARQ